jgi:hypothetical protein
MSNICQCKINFSCYQGGCVARGISSGWSRGMFTRFCWRTLKEREHLEDPVVDGTIMLKRVSKI